MEQSNTNKVKREMSPSMGDFDASGSTMGNFKKIQVFFYEEIFGETCKIFQKNILQEVRYKQPEIPDSPPTGGTLRLRTIQKKSPEQIREEKLARLSKELREKVEKKKTQLELVIH